MNTHQIYEEGELPEDDTPMEDTHLLVTPPLVTPTWVYSINSDDGVTASGTDSLFKYRQYTLSYIVITDALRSLLDNYQLMRVEKVTCKIFPRMLPCQVDQTYLPTHPGWISPYHGEKTASIGIQDTHLYRTLPNSIPFSWVGPGSYYSIWNRPKGNSLFNEYISVDKRYPEWYEKLSGDLNDRGGFIVSNTTLAGPIGSTLLNLAYISWQAEVSFMSCVENTESADTKSLSIEMLRGKLTSLNS